MPVYEYYCPSCATRFEKLRPMSAADEPVACAAGHPKAQRLISVFARPARGGSLEELPMASGGGCACGGACSCGH
jgi:putative FmdB family regulatory protein